jgi:glycosyltransferase involved in cell wall biosynthesis
MTQGLSILIPTYADSPEPLITVLLQQHCTIPFEIIVQIDGVDHLLLHQPWIKAFSAHPKVTILQTNLNKGRASTRNALATHANYSHLLFLDADTLPIHANYLQVYAQHLEQSLICGGTRYLFKWNRLLNLRYRYGKQAEETTAIERNKAPYSSFSSNNFIIHKNIFDTITFDNNIKNYGHEDTLFGWQCQQQEINILHIDNAVYHEGLESNAMYVSKTETALQTLFALRSSHPHLHTRLTHTLQRLSKHGWQLGLLYCLLPFKTVFKIYIIYLFPSVFLFNLYKLLYYYSLKNEHRNI